MKKALIVVLVLLLIAGAGVGGYLYAGSKKEDKPVTTEEPKEEPKEEPPVEKTPSKGTDKNTSGLEIVDTKTKNIELSGIEYELKIEVLKETNKETGINHFYENVYFNGYKFINNKSVYSLIVESKEHYKDEEAFKQIENELSRVRIFKDTNGKDEYLFFDAETYVYFDPNYQYIVSPNGKVIAKLFKSQNDADVWIETDNKPESPYKYKNCTNICVLEKKYTMYREGLTQIEQDFILFLPIQNIAKTDYADYSTPEEEDIIVEENKLQITNGKPVLTKAKTYKSSEGYEFTGAGGVIDEAELEYFDKDIIEPAK
jgi:hypothetical protein